MVKRLALVAALCGVAAAAAAAVGLSAGSAKKDALQQVNHFVVIYQENHSFDNLYGLWEGVNGIRNADLAHTIQVKQTGAPYGCLLQNDVNLTTPPLVSNCADTGPNGQFTGAFLNGRFDIDQVIPAVATTCPPGNVFAANGVVNGSGLPGGCTRDIVHRFYQEQYQLDYGKQDRYTTGSDAVGLTQGFYNTRALPIYRYLHSKDHPRYAILDDFFQAAFGGSFLNHQWLIAAQTPVWANAVNDGGTNDLHSVVDGNGMPNNYPLYVSPLGTQVKDQQLTASCNPGPGRAPTPATVLCGDYAVNTTQPTYQPFSPGTAATRQLPPLTSSNIGDELSAKNVDWAWYAGGWSNADGDVGAPGWTNGTAPLAANASSAKPCPDPNANAKAVWPNCPDNLFQFHHQAFDYYANYAPGTAARTAHLRDEQEFLDAAKASTGTCKLKAVSFVKPIGAENEHPGYASTPVGSDHAVQLIKAIEGSACAKDTMVILTYDEFGGQWDHVPPPGQLFSPLPQRSPSDRFGPGTRIPALVVSPLLQGRFVVDSTPYDTTSIVKTIETRYGLDPLSSRDKAVAPITAVFAQKTSPAAIGPDRKP